VWTDEIVMTSQEFQMFLQSVWPSGMGCSPAVQVRRSLSNCKVLSLNKGRIQRIWILGFIQGVFELLSAADEQFAIYGDYSIFASGLDHLTIYTGWAKHSSDYPFIDLKAICGNENPGYELRFTQ
jgi:hypothetical protein